MDWLTFVEKHPENLSEKVSTLLVLFIFMMCCTGLALSSSKSINKWSSSSLTWQWGGRTFRKRNGNRFSHHVSAFWFFPYGGRFPSVGAQSPFCGAQSPPRDASSALPSAPSPFVYEVKKGTGVKYLVENWGCRYTLYGMGCVSPEVPLLFCYLFLSKRTPCLPHRASSTSTFPCSLSQLAKLEKIEEMYLLSQCHNLVDRFVST